MSATRRLLERPLVIGAVATGLVAVALLNIWTFREDTYDHYKSEAEERSSMNSGTESVSYLMDAVVPDEEGSGQERSSAPRFSWPQDARDPFGPQKNSQDQDLVLPLSSEMWRLDAVVLRGGEQIALINGTPYRIGESLGKAKLVSIDKQGVTLLEDEDELRLPVEKEAAGANTVTVVMSNQNDKEEITLGSANLGDHGGER